MSRTVTVAADLSVGALLAVVSLSVLVPSMTTNLSFLLKVLLPLSSILLLVRGFATSGTPRALAIRVPVSKEPL